MRKAALRAEERLREVRGELEEAERGRAKLERRLEQAEAGVARRTETAGPPVATVPSVHSLRAADGI